MSNARKSNIQAIYPLSPMQRGILFNAIRATDVDPYFMQLHVGLEGPLNATLFHQAWLQVVARHDVFRTLFVFENRDIPLQLVQAKVHLPWNCLDWRTLTTDQQQLRLEEFLEEDRRLGLDLDRAPLMRMTLIQSGERSHIFVWSTHHILMDAWCKKLVLNEVATIYQKLVAGMSLNLAPVTAYQTYIKWLGRQNLEEAQQFWRDYLAGFGKTTVLPREQAVQPGRAVSGQYGTRTHRFGETQTQSLAQLARTQRLTVNAMIQACWAATLHSFNGSEDLLFGVTLSGRPEDLPGVDTIIGLFINTLPLRVTLQTGEPLLRWLEAIQVRQLDLTRFSYSPLYEIQNWCNRREQSPLFDTLLIFQNYPRETPETSSAPLPADAQLNLVKIEVTGKADYPISLTASLREDLVLQLNYDHSQFQEDVIDLMMSRMGRLLEQMLPGLNQTVDSWIQSACFSNDTSPQTQQSLEAALLAEPTCADAAVGFLADRKGNLRAIAYVVPNGPLDVAELHARLKADTSPTAVPLAAIVSVTSLPRTKTGIIDFVKLRQIPVPDVKAIQDLEAQAKQGDTLRDCAVIPQAVPKRWQRYHLGDLLAPEFLPDRMLSRLPSPERAIADAAPMKMAVSNRPKALVNGGPLPLDSGEADTLTRAFERTARDHGQNAIIHVTSYGEEHTQTYASLFADACKMLGGLQAQGLGPGNRVLLQISDSQLYFTTFWACILGGIQPVTVAIPPSYREDHAILQKIHKAWLLIGAPTLLASQELVEPLDAVRNRFAMGPFSVLNVHELLASTPSTRFYDAEPEDTAFLQLTSGSTGTPKCIPERHRAIVAHIQGTKKHNGYVPGDRFMNWMPMDHIGSILKYHIGVLYSGYTQVHAAPELIIADPLKWLDLMEKHRITHSWSPNFGFKLVVSQLRQQPQRHWDLSHLKFLLNAGEQVTMPVLRDFTQLLAPFGITPKVFQPAFGMAETCTGITYQTHFSFEDGIRCVTKRPMFEPLDFVDPNSLETPASATYFVSLGPPIPGVEICITGPDQKPLPEGVIGHFRVKGDMVHKGYLNLPEVNREAFTPDGWFNTGDLGFILDHHLYITGREKEMIVLNGANYYCHEIEELVNQVPGVEPTFAAATSVHASSNDEEELAVFFVPATTAEGKGFDVIEAIRTKLATSIGLPARHIIPLPLEDFPKTTSGKIQRNQLQKSFEAGSYGSIQREIDLFLGNTNTLAHWFYHPVWRRDHHQLRADLSQKTLVCLCDQEDLAKTLVAANHGFDRLVTVTFAKTFGAHENNRFTCNFAERDQVARVFEALTASKIVPSKIACFWKLGHGSLEERLGFWLPLLRVLATRKDPPACHVQAISLEAMAVEEHEVPNPDAAAIRSLLKTASLELPGLQTSCLDLDRDALANCDLLLEELACFQAQDVAIRANRRYSLTLVNLDLKHGADNAPTIQPGAMLLITGGLGGIGLLLAETLVKRFRARLLLMGRSPLDSPHSHAPGTLLQSQNNAWQKLLALGGNLAYASVDVCQAERLRQAIQDQEEKWGCRLAGVFHLAGVAEEASLAMATPEHFHRVMAAKVDGAKALHQVLEARPEVFFIAFSSVNGYFGGSHYGAYAAACGYLDAFANWRRLQGFPKTQTLAWTQWQDCGMSAGFLFAQAAHARGFPPLSPEEALTTLWVAMGQNPCFQLLGIDPSKASLAPQVMGPAEPSQRLTGYFVADPPIPSRLNDLHALNQFAFPIMCEWHQVERIQRDDQGQIDALALQTIAHKEPGKRPHVAPRNPLETQLAALWKELLGVPKVGIHDNYFELGGHSINATQLLLKLRNTLNVDLPLQSLFDKPTIAEIAPVLAAKTDQSAPQPVTSTSENPDFRQDLPMDGRLRIAPDLLPSRLPAEHILVTGATGFVGAFLLERLLAETDAQIWCLVRPGREQDASSRLQERLKHYQVSLNGLFSRVHVLSGDLTKPKLGLTVDAWNALAQQIDVIYHNGAQVNFVLPYSQLRAANVLGTGEILRLSTTTRLKPVHYVSTLSAIPAELHAEHPFPEDGNLQLQEGRLNGYERSKWVAEALLRQAMAQGLPATILRLGRISGHSEHGACAEDDMVIRLIQGSVLAGMLPKIPLELQMLPVDVACSAMVALTMNPEFVGRTFHLFNPHGATLGMLREVAKEWDLHLEEVPPADWLQQLTDQAQASPDHPLFPLFNLMLQPTGAPTSKAKSPSTAPYAQSATLAALAHMGLTFPKVDKDLLRTYFHYLQKVGLLRSNTFPTEQAKT